MKTKKTKLIIFTVILIIISIFIFPSIKSIYESPSVCSAAAEGDHYYAIGYINWIVQRNWIGGKATFANPNPDYSTPNSSANHTIWVTTNNSTDSWVEERAKQEIQTIDIFIGQMGSMIHGEI